MKYITILLLLTLFLAACQSPAVLDNMDDMKDADHIGCQEGEIDADGECLPAAKNNVQLFGQDFSDKVVAQDVSTQELKGYFVQPSTPGDYPGIVMIHEWWGLNDNIKEMAKLLANEGYSVFAIDLYDGEVATNSSTARVLATNVRSNPDEAVTRMKLAVEYLEDNGASSIGSLGWCFGGQQSLALSLNDEVDATVIYYGSLIDDKEQLMNIDGPVLGIFGSEDSGIPVDSVKSFKASLNDLDIESNIYIYQGVGHAFANPSGSNYAANETVDAWLKTTEFLAENLKNS